MSWRTIVVSKRSKLDMRMGYLVIRSEEETKRINMDEISILILENSAVSITGCLISALIEKKIKVIFCNEKREPACEMVPYYGSHDDSAKIRKQIKWNDDIKACIWSEIVAEKIRNQADFLHELEKNEAYEQLKNYISEIEVGDITNREGHAAKVYFNALFGTDFTRSMECTANAALNYGYSIILSAFNREITAQGYLTQLGIFHNNMFNHFNLSCDLMEPFRIIVDKTVKYRHYSKFEKEEKHELVAILNQTVFINDTEQYVSNAIKIYCYSVLEAINDNDISKIKFFSFKE